MMHECLKVPEIQRLIFQALETDRKSTHYAMALTCRAFKDVALSCLWENLESIYPLVHNLPEDALKVSSDAERRRAEAFTRPLVPEDWEIYEKYSTRVRSMYIHGDSGITERILDGLCSYRPVQHLLPLLRTLVIVLDSEDNDYSKHIQGFFSPTMKHFKLYVSGLFASKSEYGLLSSLSSLGRLSPSLITLWINYHGGEPHFIYETHRALFFRTLSRLLQDLKTLKAIYLRPFTLAPEILNRLSRLKWLQKLQIHIWPEKSPFQYDQSHQLSNLTSLEISNATWKTFSNILGIAITSPIKEIHVDFLQRHHFQNILHLVDLDLNTTDNSKFIEKVLDQLAMITALEYIVIRETVRFLPPGDLCDGVGLRLGLLKNVKMFDCVCSAASLLGDAWLETISSWSHLRVLQVFVGTYDLWPKMTLEGLLPILTNCMNLHTLQVSVECKGFDLQSFANSNLAPVRIVKLPNSPIIDHESVIYHCLTHMFPSAQFIRGSYNLDKESWQNINLAFYHLDG